MRVPVNLRVYTSLLVPVAGCGRFWAGLVALEDNENSKGSFFELSGPTARFVWQQPGRRVMEGTQPSTAGGDGAPTAMVAVPGLPGALTQAFPLLGGSGTVSMEASLRLRAKDYAAHDRWLVNLQDVI